MNNYFESKLNNNSADGIEAGTNNNSSEGNLNKAPLSEGEAEMKIRFILQEVQQIGSNDSEPFEIRQVLESLRKKQITPEEALRRAMGIQNGKQDYR
ncbi:MAG: hypothetical protein WC928_01135 [Patescibacteria group bacterium]|jgi:hypothetical protein